MAGCSKKQYAIMMSAGPEGKKLASEMGGMEQDKFNEAFNELLQSDAAVEASSGYKQEEDEDYGEFDPDSEDDYGFDNDEEEYLDSDEHRAEMILNDPDEYTPEEVEWAEHIDSLVNKKIEKETQDALDKSNFVKNDKGLAVPQPESKEERAENLDEDKNEETGRKGLVKETLVDKFNDAHLYNDGGKYQLALGNGETKEFDTKDEAIDYLSEYSKKDYSWAKDKKESREERTQRLMDTNKLFREAVLAVDDDVLDRQFGKDTPERKLVDLIRASESKKLNEIPHEPVEMPKYHKEGNAIVIDEGPHKGERYDNEQDYRSSVRSGN